MNPPNFPPDYENKHFNQIIEGYNRQYAQIFAKPAAVNYQEIVTQIEQAYTFFESKKNTGRMGTCLNLIGASLLRMNKFQEAKQKYIQMIQLNPHSGLGHYNKACVETLMGEISEGLSSLTTAFQLDPSMRDLAKLDPDLDILQNNPDYRALMNPIPRNPSS